MSTERITRTEESASDWLVQRNSGDWTPEAQARFDEWLSASTLNRVAYLRLESAWDDAARLKALGAGVPRERPPPPGQWNLNPFFEQPDVASIPPTATTTPTPARFKKIVAIAASLALLVVGAAAWYLWPAGDPYSTPVGGVASVPMTDGSKITLNTNSQIRVALTDSERRVDLKQGEAFFEVAHDLKRPFIVSAGKQRIVAVGTKFSVRRDHDNVQVVVTEGKVRLESTSDKSQTAAAATLKPQQSSEVLLAAGAIAHVGDAGVLVQRKSLPEAEDELSWRNGVLMFRDDALADAVAEFNRYNTRQIVIQDPVVAALKIEGNFRSTNVDAFVRLLESAFPVNATNGPDRIVLTSR